MGFANLSIESQEALKEIARMAWGSGFFEGSSGGSGRMGVIYNEQGEARIIKFNTNSYERSFGDSLKDDPQMLTSSNNLRELLKNLAESAGLNKKDLADIYQKLGLGADGNGPMPKTLLDRKVVAKIVSKIGGDQIWKDAWVGVDKKSYASGWKTQLKDLRPAVNGGAVSANVRTANKLVNFSSEELLASILSKATSGDYDKDSIAVTQVLMSDVYNKDINGLDTIVASGALKGISKEKLAAALDAWLKLEKHDVNNSTAVRDSFVQALKTYVPARYASAFGIRPEQLRELGVSFEELDSAITDVAVQFELNIAQRQNVAKMTMAYLASKLGDPDSRATLPSGNELLGQIKGGSFVGTFIGLMNCEALKATVNDRVIPAETILGKDGMACKFISRLDQGDCERLAFMLGKCQVGARDRDNGMMFPKDGTHPDLVVSTLSEVKLHTLVTMKEKHAEILKNYHATGKFSFDDIYQQVLGEKPQPQDITPRDRFWRMTYKSSINLVKNANMSQNVDGFEYVAEMGDRIDDTANLMSEFGLKFEDAFRVKDSGWDNSIKLHGGAPLIQINGIEFQTMTKESAFKNLDKDLARVGKGSTFTVNGKKPIVMLPGMTMGDERTVNLRDNLYSQLSQMIGFKDDGNQPLPPQLKTALYCCHQAGLSVFTLAGGDNVIYDKCDRSFELDQDGNIHVTLSLRCPPNSDRTKPENLCTAHYVIGKDGSSELVGFATQPAKQFKAATSKDMDESLNRQITLEFEDRLQTDVTDKRIQGDWFRDTNTMNNLTPEEVERDIKGDPFNVIYLRNGGRFCFLDGMPVMRDSKVKDSQTDAIDQVNAFLEKVNVDDKQPELKEALRFLMTQGPQLWPEASIFNLGLEGRIPNILQRDKLACMDIKPMSQEQGGGFDIHLFGSYHHIQGLMKKDGSNVYFDNSHDNRLTYSAVCHLSIDPDTKKPVISVKSPLELKTDFKETTREEFFNGRRKVFDEIMQGKMKTDGLTENEINDLDRIKTYLRTAPKEVTNYVQQSVWRDISMSEDPDGNFVTDNKIIEQVLARFMDTIGEKL